MRPNDYINAYKQAVREAFRTHLQPLGYRLVTGKQNMLSAESAFCRIIFQPQAVFPVVQKADKDPSLAHRAYGLHVILKASSCEEEFELAQIEGPETLNLEIDRMVKLLLEQCAPVLSGDEDAWKRVVEVATEDDDQAFDQLSELGIRLKENGQWRELPELESVEVKTKHSRAAGTLAVLLFLPLMLLFPVLMLALFLFDPGEPMSVSDKIGAFVLAAACIPLAVRLLKQVRHTQYSWQTGKDGLTIGRYRHNQFVRWSDIEVVGVIPSVGYEFRTAKDRIRLDKEALQNTRMEASIWQHLTRAGKAQDIILSDFAMSLWAEIPDEKLDSIEWESPLPVHLFDIVLRFVALEAFIWALAYRFDLDPIGVGIVASWWPVVWLASRLIAIKRVSVDDDRVSAVTALGKRTIPWTAVRSVKFINPGIRQPASLQIRGPGLKFIRIPWIPQHPNSTRVMLAILRRLRQQERFRLLPFPTILLTADHVEDQP